MSRTICSVAFVLLGLVVSASAQDFTSSMQHIFTGKQFKKYQWASYPMDDYGVGTAYRGTTSTPAGGTFLCATYTCLSLAKPDITKETGLKDWLIVSAPASSGNSVSALFADSGCGTGLDSTLQNNSTWAVRAIVPQIMGVLGLTSNFSNDKDAKITLSTGRVCNRKLLQVKAIRYLTSTDHEDTYGIREAYNNKRLTLVLEDLVITSFDFTISAKGDLKAGLDAKLTQDPTGHFGDNSSFSFSVEKKGSNEFHLKSTTPLIVGFLAESNHNVPIGQGVGPGMLQPWDGWEPTTVNLPKRGPDGGHLR